MLQPTLMEAKERNGFVLSLRRSLVDGVKHQDKISQNYTLAINHDDLRSRCPVWAV